MADKIDRLTIYVENGQIVKVTPEDPSTDAGQLKSEDYQEIVTKEFQVIASSIGCYKYPDGKCYRVIAGRKYLCDCPS